MTRFVTPAAIAAGLLAFAPWGSVSVRVLGVWSPAFQFKGTEIDSGIISGVQAGWVVVVLAVVALVAARGSHGTLRLTAALLLLFAVYSAATLAHHTISVTAANGQDVSNLLDARVSIAWGSFAEVAASALLLVAALTAARVNTEVDAPDAESSYSDDEIQP